METLKKTGVWMDHSHAYIIAFPGTAAKPRNIFSGFTHQDKGETLQRSESAMHNKQQQKQAAYYNDIAAALSGCDEVLLFGPTDAKKELFNRLRNDHHFDSVKIQCEDAGKMTPKEQSAFIGTYFALKES